MSLLIEAAVESVDAALAAAEGGAQRVELCADLAHGGTTPALDLILECRHKVTIPVFVLVRPRTGDFVYTEAEHDTILQQIRRVKNAGAQGIVAGELTDGRRIAEGRTLGLLEAARPLPFTFHRAFDDCLELGAALESLIRLGVNRVLTSGGARTASDGAERIERLVTQAKGRIEILAGGGITADNVAHLVRVSGVGEIHFSVTEANKVRKITDALNDR
ncbi:MAG TPA: copper homeostasis protein CutC [Gemmatimonadales bacterium]|nr:copper homeostasis protein CutC [Gemmatimonadales bacterium]